MTRGEWLTIGQFASSVFLAAAVGFAAYEAGKRKAAGEAENYPRGSCAEQIAECESRGGHFDAWLGKASCRKSVTVVMP